jgi:hypothetical protein
MFFLLLSLSVSSSCTRFTSSSTTETIKDAIFDGCHSTSNGGAIYLAISSLSADIISCTFLNCSSDGGGGAIYFSGFHLSILQSSTFSCVAAQEGTSLYAYYATSPATFQFSDGASVGGSSQSGTFCFFAGSSTGSESSIERANVTGNTVSTYGAAVYFNQSDTVRFQFCEIRSNEGSNCICFSSYQTDLIRCLSIRSNIADDRDTTYQGLFFAYKSMTISESVIAGNNASLLVHGWDDSELVTFSNCHFDAFEQEVSGVTFSMVGCLTDGNEFPGLPPTCLTQTISPINNRSVTGTFTQPLQILFHARKMWIVRFGCFLTVIADYGLR